MRWSQAYRPSASRLTAHFCNVCSARPIPASTKTGWNKLTRNWALFFAFMAVLNETVWRNSSDQLLDRVQAVGRPSPHFPVRRSQHPDATSATA